MTAGSIYDNGTDPRVQEQEPQIIDSNILRILKDFAHKMEHEGDKATAEIAKRYGHNLSQRIPEVVWGSPGRSIIDVGRGFLGRKNPTDVARQETAKTIEDLHKLLAYFHANQQRFIDYSHYVLTESRRRIAERNYTLPDEIRDYGRLIELIGADHSLRTVADSLEMINAIGKTEIARTMPRR
jgi:hypothetical protein